ncbi:MAG: hypothetical protein ACKVPY_09985 [Paracoccaceae bacterium]
MTMAQADLYDNKPSVAHGAVRLLASVRFLLPAFSLTRAKSVAKRRAPDPREAGYLADIDMEVGI